TEDAGARLDVPVVAATASAPTAATLLPWSTSSFLEFHSARVRNDLLFFNPAPLDIHPPTRPSKVEKSRKPLAFVGTTEADDPLEIARIRDQMRRFQPEHERSALPTGIALF